MDRRPENTRKKGRALLKFSLLALVCAGILGSIVAAVGLEETLQAVRQAGFLAFGVMGVLALMIITLQASAWAALNRPIGHHVPLKTLLEGAVLGMAVNILTPSSYLGGEPVKVFYVRRRTGLPVGELTGTIVLSKYLEAISFLLLFGIATGVAALVFSQVLFGPPYLSAGIGLLAIATILFGLGAVLWISLNREWRPLTFLARQASRIRPSSAFLARLHVHTGEMEHQVTRVANVYTNEVLTAFGFFLLSHVAIFFKPAFFFFLGARIGLGPGELCLIFVTSQALLAFQLTPSGVGILDGGMIGTFALLGLDEAHAMAFLLSIRFWDAINVGLGALLAARVGAKLVGQRPPPANHDQEAGHGPAV